MVELKHIRPAPVISIFLATSVLLCLGIYLVIPFLLSYHIPFLISYLIAFQITPFILIFILLLTLYRIEGNTFEWKILIKRLRLQVTIRNIVIGFLLAIFGILTYVLLQPVSIFLAYTNMFSPPSWFAPDLNPILKSEPGSFMGMQLHGQVLIPLLYFVGWIFNILGEELLFRGYLLPRMELSFGNKAWLFNGTCWWLWHCFWRWQLIALMPFVFILPFIAQKTRSTVPGIIAHGCMNIIAIVIITLSVFK
jgi:membrane protease YdiL (CAAX protease family)